MLSFVYAVPAAYSFYRDMPGDSYAQKPAQILKKYEIMEENYESGLAEQAGAQGA